MVKIVLKKEGATQVCGKCGSDLICRLKDYGGNFAPTLQWQNFDTTPHFKTTDGIKYACNVPDEEQTAQTRIPSEIPTEAPPATTPGDSPTGINSNLLPLSSILEKIDSIMSKLNSVDEMVEAIFRYTVDEQLKKK